MKKNLLVTLLLSLSVSATLQAQIITTLVGNGLMSHTGDGSPATAATITNPYGTAVDSRGNVYVSEYTHYVRKIDHNGYISTVAGGLSAVGPLGDGGPATAAYLDVITDLAFDQADNLYIVDHGNSRIRKVDKAGIITTIAGGGSMPGDGVAATNAKLDHLNGMTIDAAGNIYIGLNDVVRKISTSGIVTTIAGGAGFSGYAGDGGPATLARLQGAYDIAIDKPGNIYITDQYNNTIRKINTSGIMSTVCGTPSMTGSFSGDGGPSTAATINVPWGIVTDLNDNVIFCDAYNNVVRQISSATGIINTVAGNGLSSYFGDGFPATAAAAGSTNVAVDCGFNLYLSGSVNRLRMVTYTHQPFFMWPDDSLRTCIDAGPKVIDTLLKSAEQDVSLPISWTVDVAPAHGSIGGVPSGATATGGLILPSGITYTPTPGYVGPDSFTMQVAYCSQVADWRKIYVMVYPRPTVAPVTGSIDTVCPGHSIVLTDATPGGVWSVSNTAAAASGTGTITGLYPGWTTVQYTVTQLGCSTVMPYALHIMDCVTGVNTMPAFSSVSVYPNPAGDVVHVTGLTTSCTYKVLDIVGRTMATGVLNAYTADIDTRSLVPGVYTLELTSVDNGAALVRKIIKS